MELSQSREVARDPVVGLPASDDACQPATGLAHRGVATADKLLLNRRQGSTHPAGHREPQEREAIGPMCPAANVREPKEVEGLTLAASLPLTSDGAVRPNSSKRVFVG